MIQQQPYEVLFRLLISLPYQSIINFCSTNREYREICNDPYFWITKANIDFEVSNNEFLNTQLNPQDRYLQLLAMYGQQCIKGSERVVPINTCFKLASESNDVSLITYFLQKGATNLEYGIYAAAAIGDINLFNLLVSSHINLLNDKILNKAVAIAAENNHLPLIKLLISQAVLGRLTLNSNTIDNALLSAVKNGNLELVKYLLTFEPHTIDVPLYHASRGGYKDIVNLLIDSGINFNPNDILAGAAKGGHIDLINLARELGANDYQEGLNMAAQGGHRNVVDYFIKLGANDLNSALEYAGNGGSIDLVDYLLSLGATDLNVALRVAAGEGHINLVRYIIENQKLIKERYPMVILPTINDLNEGLIYLIELAIGFNIIAPNIFDTINYLISNGTNNINEALKIAIKDEHPVLINYLKSLQQY